MSRRWSISTKTAPQHESTNIITGLPFLNLCVGIFLNCSLVKRFFVSLFLCCTQRITWALQNRKITHTSKYSTIQFILPYIGSKHSFKGGDLEKYISIAFHLSKIWTWWTKIKNLKNNGCLEFCWNTIRSLCSTTKKKKLFW